MMELTVKAYGKINLSLDIIRKLPSGFHDMRMVMETVELHDDIQITLSEGDGVSMRSNLSFLPSDSKNIAVKAAKLFFEALSLPKQHVAIKLFKRIPVAAGMAGGSANAAAVLRGLNILLETGLSKEELMHMGAELGSDVPYCIVGGTKLAEGRGEVLTALPALPDCHIVICKPKFSISTPELFSRIDCSKIRHRPDTDGLLHALEARSLNQVSMRLFNVFEDVLDSRGREIGQIKTTLLHAGALGAAMTGTGPTVFGLFDKEADANSAYIKLKEHYRETFLTRNHRESLV